jgi:hypothetical protein
MIHFYSTYDFDFLTWRSAAGGCSTHETRRWLRQESCCRRRRTLGGTLCQRGLVLHLSIFIYYSID